MKEIIDEVLKRIVPTPEEEKKLREIVGEIKREIDERKPSAAESMLVGSVAKGTWLKNSLDIDFFLLFPPSYTKEEMAENVISIGKEILKDAIVQYAEHPYIRGYYAGYEVDIVPCYKVKKASEKISAVDRTPFHTKYVIEHLGKEAKNEVRLLKQFLKGIGCYGAEAKIGGFSGYLAELLIIKFGSFLNVLKEAQNWKGKVILSLDGIKKNFPENFVFVDPVDENRNVAAALSPEKLQLFMVASSQFLKKPSIKFFFPNPSPSIHSEELLKKLSNFVGICFKKPSIADDILYPQLRKAANNVATLLQQYDFKPLRKAWHANKYAFFAVELESITIEETKLHMGPPLHEKKHVKSFINKWKAAEEAVSEPFFEKGRVWVKIKRRYTDAFHLLEEKFDEINFGKNLNEMKAEMKICGGEDLIKFKEYWEEFFCEKYPWER